MNILLIGTALFIVVIIIEAFLKEKKKSKKVDLQYNTVDSLMNKTEKEFFNTLIDSVQNQYHVFSKVRLLDIFVIPKQPNYKHKQILKNYIKSKHVDFLLCDKETLKPLIAIELDGNSTFEQKTKRT